ncbi:hypothetical protein AGMMS50276_04990 [Synergistales bacterium]|nr:hypothetical protein AGMMS50276_04990 [Synergistales bacterium]
MPTLEEFLTQTEGNDRVFLDDGERDFLATCAAMANGDGGWVILSANNTTSLIERLRARLSDKEKISANPVSFFQTLSDGDRALLAARVEPASWFLRPISVAGDEGQAGGVLVYRRIEENNVVSGQNARFSMALDALESSRDDYATALDATALDDDSVSSYRASVTSLRPEWSSLSNENFLKRTLVTDEDGQVTKAGQLILGLPSVFDKRNKPLVRARPIKRFKGIKVQTAHNLWSAWTNMLPPILDFLEPSMVCLNAVRECFLMAFIGADYDSGNIEIELSDESLTFRAHGLPRFCSDARLDARNLRSERIFASAGISSLGGLEIIRACDENFHISLDTLEIRTSTTLNLGESRPKPILSEDQPLKVLPSYLDQPQGYPVLALRQ